MNAHPGAHTATLAKAAVSARIEQAGRLAHRESHQPQAACRALLLTSGLGSGHVRAVKAIEEAWRASDPSATLGSFDFWSLMDPAVADLIQQGYLRLVSEHPDLYDRAYRLDQGVWRRLLAGGAVPAPLRRVLQQFARESRRPGLGVGPTDRWLFVALLAVLKGHGWGRAGGALRSALLGLAYRRLAHRLAARIDAYRPDVIVVTELWPAVLLTPLKAKSALPAPVVGVLTDYGVHDLWAQARLDHYCVASTDMAASLRAAGIDEARISITGIPLMPGFRDPPSQETARQALGLDPARPVALLLGGGLGLGLEEAAAALANGTTDAQWLVVTGRNRDELERLSALPATAPNLKVYGWTERMAHFMRAADVVVGKPGGLTVAEAMACGRPLVATHCLRGQEGFNVRFLQAHGVGRLVPATTLLPDVAALLADRSQLAATQERAWALGHRDSAQQAVLVAQRLAGTIPSRRPKGEPSSAQREGIPLSPPPHDHAEPRARAMRRVVQAGMGRVDTLYRRWHRLQPVGEVLYAGRTRYRGAVREFADGTRLAPGDFIGTLHFNNARFPALEADTAARAALRFARLMLESMHALADLARRDPMFADLPVYHAVTWLPPHGQRVGFVAEPFTDGLRKRLLTAYFRLLVWTFAAAEQTRATARPDPTVYWLTRSQLTGRFPGAAQ